MPRRSRSILEAAIATALWRFAILIMRDALHHELPAMRRSSKVCNPQHDACHRIDTRSILPAILVFGRAGMLYFTILCVVQKTRARRRCITELGRNHVFCGKTTAILPQRVFPAFNIIKGEKSAKNARGDALMSSTAVTRGAHSRAQMAH